MKESKEENLLAVKKYYMSVSEFIYFRSTHNINPNVMT